MLYKEIGMNIRNHRIAKGITQEQLADRVGISLSFLGHIERGTRKLSVDTLHRLLIELDCSADEALGLLLPPAKKQQYAREILQRALMLLEHEI